MRPSTLAELADTAGIPVPEIRGYGSFTAFADTYLAACHGAPDPGGLRPPGLRGRGGQRPRRCGLGGAVVLRPSPPRPLRRRRGRSSTWCSTPPSSRRATARRRGRGDARRRPHGRSRRSRSTRPASPPPAPGAAWCPSVSPTTRPSDRPSPSPTRSPSPRRPGLLSAPHAGELAGPESVRGALDTLGSRPAPARRARDRGPRARRPPRRFRHRASTCARRRTCCCRCTRRSPSTRSPSSWPPGSGAASTATTRCCSAPCCSRSTRSARTEMRARRRGAGVDRPRLDRRVGRARAAQGVGATLDRRLARNGLTPGDVR